MSRLAAADDRIDRPAVGKSLGRVVTTLPAARLPWDARPQPGRRREASEGLPEKYRPGDHGSMLEDGLRSLQPPPRRSSLVPPRSSMRPGTSPTKWPVPWISVPRSC